MPEIIDVWFFVGLAVLAASTAIIWGIRRGSKFLQDKSKNDLLDRGVQGLENVTTMVVRELAQTTRREMMKARDPNSPGGTSITKEEAKQLRDEAVQKIVSYFGMPGLMKIVAEFGATPKTEREVESFVGTMVEAKVNELKNGS